MNLNWSPDVYLEAYRFAAHAHQGQLYPGTDLPYIMHLSFVCMEVIAALQVEPNHNGNLAVTCALLHDVLEDTPTSFSNLQAAFGPEVAQGVQALSKDPSLEKSIQMTDCLRRIQQQPTEIWIVKLADRISNLQTPPSYWTVEKINRYRQEAQVIYDALHTSSQYLAQRLASKIENYGAAL